MNNVELPKTQQPEAIPEHPITPPPSLWTYGVLLLFAVILVLLAFRDKADWPELFINLASGIFGAVIVLIFVERRLRASEVQQVRQLPKQVRFVVNFGLFPTFRQVYRYGRAFHVQLRQALGRAVEPTNVHQLYPKVYDGLILLARSGSGKTTSLQFAAAKVTQEFLNAPDKKKVPLLFPLRRWLSNRTLEQALFEHVNSYVKVSRRAFGIAMKRGTFVGILDGTDEMFPDTDRNFENQFAALRKKYPRVAWSISSRSNNPARVIDLPVVILSPPTQGEIREIQKRLG